MRILIDRTEEGLWGHQSRGETAIKAAPALHLKNPPRRISESIIRRECSTSAILNLKSSFDDIQGMKQKDLRGHHPAQPHLVTDEIRAADSVSHMTGATNRLNNDGHIYS